MKAVASNRTVMARFSSSEDKVTIVVMGRVRCMRSGRALRSTFGLLPSDQLVKRFFRVPGSAEAFIASRGSFDRPVPLAMLGYDRCDVCVVEPASTTE